MSKFLYSYIVVHSVTGVAISYEFDKRKEAQGLADWSSIGFEDPKTFKVRQVRKPNPEYADLCARVAAL